MGQGPGGNIFRESIVAEMLEAQDLAEMPRLVMCVDIDNTFRMKDGRLGKSSQEVADFAAGANIPLIAITGAGFAGDVELRIAHGELPQFPVVVSSAGTRRHILYRINGLEPVYKEDINYPPPQRRQHFDKDRLRQRLGRGKFKEGLAARVHWDPAATDNIEPYKLSGTVELPIPGQSRELEKELSQLSPEIYPSVGRDLLSPNTPHYWVDLVAYDKLEAAEQLRAELQAKVMIRAGDSANDRRFLLADHDLSEGGGWMRGAWEIAIIVGGAEASLVEAYLHKAPESRGMSESYEIVQLPDGRPKLYYRELSPALGPDSILRALTILLRVLAEEREVQNGAGRSMFSGAARAS